MGMLINGVNVSIHDLNQRYRDTYIKVSLPDKLLPVVVLCKLFSDNVMYYQLSSRSESVKCALDEVKIITDFPEMGACNVAGNVHVLSIRPERQWQRGLCQARITSFTRNQKLRPLYATLSVEKADEIYNRVYISESVGLQQIREGHLSSFAMNSMYWYSGTPTHIYLWRHKTCVGELLGTTLFFFDQSSILTDEIQTDLRNIHG